VTPNTMHNPLSWLYAEAQALAGAKTTRTAIFTSIGLPVELLNRTLDGLAV